ncbi:hypothetical protein Taro_056782 [Colocasia esculenta]|uniref:Uncharacterized protein n=1 Tax=Colocasia esculenta TaxID=4460 RepID=A0A843XYG0_COLES|nr:hypothetical protein [Colocasia esculenta]
MPLKLGAPGSEESQARGCAQGLFRYSGTIEVLSSSETPSLSGRVVVQLRERRQWDSDLWWHSCVCVSVVVPHGGSLGDQLLRWCACEACGLGFTVIEWTNGAVVSSSYRDLQQLS